MWCFFFFKQKTAYEMRISDWSSDVCSSDLSWTTLSYSGMVSKALDLGVSIADVEKVNREIYAGVGNRLTNMASIIQKMPCHVIVIGHPDNDVEIGRAHV